MRPASETHLALLQAAHAIRRDRMESGHGATLQELVERSQVGYKCARALIPKLKERGQLAIVGERRVEYRNRPVAEYAPVDEDPTVGEGFVNLGSCMADWIR